MKLLKNSKYLFIGLFIIVTILAFLIIKDFINSILSSFVLAYLFHPLYKKLNLKIKKDYLSALLITLLLILIVIVPSLFIINSLVRESVSLYDIVTSGNLIFPTYILSALDKITQYIITESSKLLIALPKFFLHAFITLFLFFYFLKDGEKIVNNIKDLIPLSSSHRNTVMNEFRNVTHAIVYGVILTGIIVGITATLGFYIFNVKNPILWGLAVLVVSVLPGVGNALIWIPAGIIKIFNNDLGNGIGILIYGALLISGLEVFIKPKLIGYKANIHPALIILGVFGGLSLLGFIGLFFGPLILLIFMTFLKFLVKETT